MKVQSYDKQWRALGKTIVQADAVESTWSMRTTSCALTPIGRDAVDVIRIGHAHFDRMSRSSVVVVIVTVSQRNVARKLLRGDKIKLVQNVDTVRGWLEPHRRVETQIHTFAICATRKHCRVYTKRATTTVKRTVGSGHVISS